MGVQKKAESMIVLWVWPQQLEGRASLEGNIRSLILSPLSLRCLLDTQVELMNRERSRQTYTLGNGYTQR